MQGRDPSYDPTGQNILYVGSTGTTVDMVTNNWEIFVMTIGTPGAKRLTNSGKYDGEPTWSPDGSQMAFASERSGRPQIWTMSSSTGGNLLRITHSTRDDVDPAWSH